MIELLFFLLGLIIGLLSGITFICLYFVKSVSGNSILELPSINSFENCLNENAIQLIETEGDPCGVMNHIRIIILVDTLFKDVENSNAFSILFQRGFVLGKNKYTCLACPLFDCNAFISYSIQAKCWAIHEVSISRKR